LAFYILAFFVAKNVRTQLKQAT